MSSHPDTDDLGNNLNDKIYEKYNYPLEFEVVKECKVSKARYSILKLPHATVETPQFMPVGTKGTLKGFLPHQIKELDCNLILANTYHLGTRPVGKINSSSFRFQLHKK
jgi:tRNA-guanine family transglycosylase